MIPPVGQYISIKLDLLSLCMFNDNTCTSLMLVQIQAYPVSVRVV